jgi:hypothetical protein
MRVTWRIGCQGCDGSMAHGINANIVHGWRRLAREGNVTEAPLYVPVAIPSSPPRTLMVNVQAYHLDAQPVGGGWSAAN